MTESQNTGALERNIAKVPEVTLVFWIIKIAATTLGETGGDTVTMTLNWGDLLGTAFPVAPRDFRHPPDRREEIPSLAVLGNDRRLDYRGYDNG